MKMNKTIGRVATTLVATAMLASLAAPVYAATPGTTNDDGGVNFTDPAPTATIDITKTIQKPENMYMPDATFKFSVESYAGMTNVNTDAVKMTDDTITSKPQESDVGKDKSSITLSDVATVTVDASKFKEPGEYEFTIKEDGGTYENGKTWADQELKLKVWITEETLESGGTQMEVYGYSLYKEGASTTKLSGFTNTYFGGNTKPEDNSFELNKVVAGNFATSTDKTTKHFTFNVSIANDSLLGEAGTQDDLTKWYKVTVEHTDACEYKGTDVAYIVANAAAATPIELANGDKVTIEGLTANETITVKEASYTEAGFNEVTYKVGNADEQDLTSNGFSEDGSSDKTATVTNTKTSTNPTGIVMDIAPYALLVVIAAAGCFVFLRKRRED